MTGAGAPVAGVSDPPITAEEFARRMEALGPFEPSPLLAVAVSGGADSVALIALAAGWARDRCGRAAALVVDHRLRPESGREAELVAGRLDRHGIEAHVLVRRDSERRGGVQAAAREARYRLLTEWCRERGALHLLTAHHADDLAETLLLRLARGSGAFGLAGMAPIHEVATCRVLRPLLGVRKARLVATATAMGQGWVEDPSNDSAAFARVRFRRSADVLEAEGLGPERLGATAHNLGRARIAIEAALGRRLAASVSLHPAGFARVDVAQLLAEPGEIALRALAAVVTCIGGREHPPRLERLERLGAALAGGDGVATLSGCRVEHRAGLGLVAREPEQAVEHATLAPGTERLWDGRFRIGLAADAGTGPLQIGPLGGRDWALLVAERADLRDRRLPDVVRRGLPALRDPAGIVAVPTLGYGRGGEETGSFRAMKCVFAPRRPLAGPDFALARPGADTISGSDENDA